MDEAILTVSGTVENVIYKNSENGYIVLELDYRENGEEVGRPLVAVGNLGDIAEGEKLTLTGSFIATAKYGRQFKAMTCERALPETPEEIARYLGSGILTGIGLKTATQIVKTFGTETLNVIENNPERLHEIKGISLEKALSAGSQYKKLCGVNTVTAFLSDFGIGPASAIALWQRYNSSSVALIRENPYLLCGEGIELEFSVADKIAEKFKLDMNSMDRVKAGIAYILLANTNMGHTCLPLEAVRERAFEDLGLTRDAFEIGLYEAIEEKKFYIVEVVERGINRQFLYLANYYRAESYIADKLSQMLKLNPALNKDFSEEIAGVEWEEGIKYETLQKAAINGALGNNLFILTGGPGTGKTTTLNAVIKLLKRGRRSLSLAAPTGRAAKRMSELTGEKATTIHRLLEVDTAGDNMLKFKRNEDNPLKSDVVIIDETSMVDALLFEALLKALKLDAKLILTGDSDQLPSVGAGNVLKDLITSEKIACVRLTEIFRQAAESLIVTNAHKIVHGIEPDLNSRDKDFFFMNCASEEELARTVVGLVKERLPKAYNLNPVEDIQVLVPTKLGVSGTRELNKLLQNALNPASVKKREIKHFDVVFRTGDKIMQTVNDYNVEWVRNGEKGLGVFNGDIGVIVDIDRHSGSLNVNFDGRATIIPPALFNKIEHAFAVTVHKSQGSEYKAVVMPLPANAKRLLYRSLLYTGVTRARDLLILAGRRETVLLMTENQKRTRRYSCLKELMKKY